MENDRMSLEHYIATKILRSSDAINPHRLSEMMSLIKQLLETDSEVNEQIKNNQNHVPTSNSSSWNTLKSNESTFGNNKVGAILHYFKF